MLSTLKFKFSYEMLVSEVWDLQMPSENKEDTEESTSGIEK